MADFDLPRLKECHRLRWKGLGVWVILFLAFLLAECLLALAVHAGSWWAAVPLVVLLAHLMHGHTIAFHEAAHRSLCPSRFWNDAIGYFVGFHALMSLTLYRTVHRYHHAYLATDRDEELWPFNQPDQPRWFRRLAAACELTLGLFYTPLLFLRAFLRRGSLVRNPALRRRIRLELIALAVFWAGLLTLVTLAGVWFYFLILFLIPAMLAGNFQSLRKYVEHVGLTGSTVRSSTRSVVASDPAGRLIAFTLLNEPYHGVHHVFGKLPCYNLPEFASVLEPASPEEHPPYPSYFHAIRDLISHLPDPRVGAQWRVNGGASEKDVPAEQTTTG